MACIRLWSGSPGGTGNNPLAARRFLVEVTQNRDGAAPGKRRALNEVEGLLEWEARYCDFNRAKFPAGQDGLSRKNNGTEV